MDTKAAALDDNCAYGVTVGSPLCATWEGVCCSGPCATKAGVMTDNGVFALSGFVGDRTSHSNSASTVSHNALNQVNASLNKFE